MTRAASLASALAMILAACTDPPASASGAAPAVATPEPEAPDAARGAARIVALECSRCHETPGVAPPAQERQCVGCHRAILDGDFEAPAADLRRWRRSLVSLNHAPSLVGLEGHLRSAWIASFLQAPHDVRPGLPATMPRLPLSERDAWDVAAALAGPPEATPPSPAPDMVSVTAGLELLDARGCYGCHAFGDRAAAPPVSSAAQALAPDLRHTRARMTRRALLAWLADPEARRPGTSMPRPELSAAERAAVADAILGARLEAPPDAAPLARLPLLERPVRFAEVSERVLSRTCWHCHADPDFAQGDGGAGNTGGFGYPPRGVSLMDYPSVSSGYLDADGERRSLFAEEDGTPHLVRVLMARHAEVRGAPVPGLTGMPLGLPPVPLEDIQLVETWIAQGRPN